MGTLSVSRRVVRTVRVTRVLGIATLAVFIGATLTIVLWTAYTRQNPTDGRQAVTSTELAAPRLSASDVRALGGSTDAGASLRRAVNLGTYPAKVGVVGGSTDCGASLERAVHDGAYSP